MAGIKPNEFDIEFIERTQLLIKNYKGDTEFSLLLNCLLGLIIVPNEFNKLHTLAYLNQPLVDVDIVCVIINLSTFNQLIMTNYKGNMFHQMKHWVVF